MTRGRAMLLLLLLALACAATSAAPKVPMKIVARPKIGGEEEPVVEPPEEPVATGPVLRRQPMPPQGPFSSSLSSLACLTDNAMQMGDEEVRVDICHLANITYVRSVAAEPSDASSSQEPTETRGVLGVYRGWEIDPITLEYKYMIFTDGDDCDDSGNTFQFELELVRKTPKAPVRVFGFKEVEPCVYTAKLAVHVPPQELHAQEGIHSPGVIDISPAQETLPKVCGEMTCKYDTIANRLQAISNQIASLNRTLHTFAAPNATDFTNLTLTSSSMILRSTNSVLERSLNMLYHLEALSAELASKSAVREESEQDDEAVEGEEEAQPEEAEAVETTASGEQLIVETEVAAEL